MNAACRQWDRVGWYPTHYCCLDEEVVLTHRDAIRRLLDDRPVETAFLSGKIVEFHPDLAEDLR
jgi:hypothetical protein